MDILTIIIAVVIGLVLGIIFGAIYFVYKILISSLKSQKDYLHKERLFQVKDNPNQIIEEQIKNQIKKAVPQVEDIVPKINTFDYKKDFKQFQYANKMMEKEKKRYEKGKISYQELVDKFNYYKTQDYYKRIMEKDYGQK